MSGSGRLSTGLDDDDLDCSEDCKSEDEMRRVIEDSDTDSPSQSRREAQRKKSKNLDKLVKLGVGGLNLAAVGNEEEDDTDQDDDDDVSDTGDENDEEGEDFKQPFMGPNAKCKRHNLKIHSYRKGTKRLLCT